MGEVWIATHVTLGGELALKFLGTHDEDEATAMARFRLEAQLAAKLSRRTRHIVSVTDHGEEHGRAYLVMELVHGESLAATLVRGWLPLPLLTAVVVQLAKGLAHAHAEGVFHRDLKPANVLLGKDEDGALQVKILDFGIAKATRAHRSPEGLGPSTEAGMVLGTPTYMSPEQARGLPSLDHRCDLWALAVLAYESLCNAFPYDGETTYDLLVNVCSTSPIPLRRFREDLPVALEAFFARAFAPDLDDRFPDASTFASAFYAAATSENHLPPPEELVLPKPRRWLVPVAALALVSVAGAVGWRLRSPAHPQGTNDTSIVARPKTVLPPPELSPSSLPPTVAVSSARPFASRPGTTSSVAPTSKPPAVSTDSKGGGAMDAGPSGADAAPQVTPPDAGSVVSASSTTLDKGEIL